VKRVLRRLGLVRARPEQEPAPEPLRVMTPRVFGGVRGFLALVGRFGLVILLTWAVLLLPTPAGLLAAGHRAIAGFIFTASILALEPVSLPIAALMVPIALVALEVADTPQAFETFSRPVVFLILGGMFLAEGLRKHGLTRRLALTAVILSGGRTTQLVIAIMAVSAAFAMWVESTATSAMLIPVAMTVATQVKDRDAARGLLVLLVLGIGYGASLGGMTTILGSSSNAVASSFLSQVRPWTFVDWMIYGLPAFALIFPLSCWMLLRMVPVTVTQLDSEPIRHQLDEMGPMSRVEYEILATLGAAIVLWVAGPLIEEAFVLPPTLLAASMVAVMAVSYLAVREIITWDDLKGVSWGMFFIIGAGLSLGEALTRSGVSEWFAGLIAPLAIGAPLLLTLLFLVLASALLTNVLNNTTIAAVLSPILIRLAHDEPAFNAVQLVLPVTLATTFGYSLPSASGRMALIAATGAVGRGEMFRYGFKLTLASSLVLALLFYFLAVVGWI
jgi:sodium-dependent dicarboxylate transporter 2/3/5